MRMINALVKTQHKRHMQFLTSTPNFREGSAYPSISAFPSLRPSIYAYSSSYSSL